MKPVGSFKLLSTLAVLLASITLTGCDQGVDESVQSQLNHFEAMKTELDPEPFGRLPEKSAENFSPVPKDTPFFYTVKRQQPNCYASVDTFVRGQKGNNCIIGDPNQAMAEIAGFSARCVDNCDTPARLREVNAAAAGTCNGFCAQFKCAAQYAPRAQCGASACYAGDPNCNAEWPLMDYCMLLQAAQVWNCQCVPDVTG